MTTGKGAFVPTRISIAHVTTGSTVLAEPRDANGVLGTPPLTTSGKEQFAWDETGPRPGSSQGNVLLNAHTWPDGSAMGNALLASLNDGDHITLADASGHAQCYQVTDEVTVPAVGTPQRVLDRFYDTTGPPQLGIVVCSGQRLGQGQWTARTLWFAKAV